MYYRLQKLSQASVNYASPSGTRRWGYMPLSGTRVANSFPSLCGTGTPPSGVYALYNPLPLTGGGAMNMMDIKQR